MNPFKQQKIGVGIGSGGVYAATGLGAIQRLEEKNLKIPFIGGASAGAILAALYYLEGDAKKAETIFLKKLPHLDKLRLYPWKKPVESEKIKKTISVLIDNRDWQDGKIQGACFGAAFLDTREPIILTRSSGLNLTDSLLASVSLKMIEPIIKLNQRLVAHGGDPDYLQGLRKMGAELVIGVSPNLEAGISGKIARVGNLFSSLMILRKDYWRIKQVQEKRKKEKANLEIRPSISIKPLIFPLNFSEKNVKYMIRQGRELMDLHLPKQKK